MNLKVHIRQYLDIYLVVLSWVFAGAFTPPVVAIIWPAVSFLLILRTANYTKILLAVVMMLIFSDSRMLMFNFAETAKILIVVILFLSVILDFKHYRNYNNKIFKYLLPFLVFSVAATFWSVDTMAAFQKSVSYALVCFTIPLVFLRAYYDNDRFGIDFIAFIFIVIGLGLFLYFLNPIAMTLAGRYHGLLGNPNGLGIFQVLAFPLCYLFWRQSRHRYPLGKFVWVFLAVFTASIILTGSRTSIFAIFIFFLFTRLRYFSNWATIIGFLTLIIGFEYFMQQLPGIIRGLSLEEYFRLDTLRRGSGRDVAWAFALQNIDNVYFAGGGFGYTEYIYRINYQYLSMLGHQGNAHNSYLTLWLDTGLIGLTLFAIGIIRIIIDSIKYSLYTLPVVFAVLFSTYYESWLAASLNPFTSLFLIMLTFLAQKESPLADAEVTDSDLSPYPEEKHSQLLSNV